MGGRGSSSGISDKGKVYGSEYTTIMSSGNIKFVRYNDSTAAKAPQETMTKGRVYVTIDQENEPKYITFYDTINKRFKQIDLKGRSHTINGKPELPHIHYGYEHDENGSSAVNNEDQKLIDRVKKIWYNRRSK